MDIGNKTYSHKHPAVKRIMQEIKELHSEDSPDFKAEAIEDNIFEWHFAIRGPPDTEFEGGIYHGRILLPSEYPFKPPEFIMLSPTGRWETNTQICLSISSHHPEHWQPSWSVRTALMALKAFMPTPANGAIGSLDFPKDERQRLAKLSRRDPPRFGNAERQEIVDSIHEKMLTTNAPENASQATQAEASNTRASTSGRDPDAQNPLSPVGTSQVASEIDPVQQKTSRPQGLDSNNGSRVQKQPTHSLDAAGGPAREGEEVLRTYSTQDQAMSSWEERGLNYLAIALVIAILAVLGRKAFAGVDIADFS